MYILSYRKHVSGLIYPLSLGDCLQNAMYYCTCSNEADRVCLNV